MPKRKDPEPRTIRSMDFDYTVKPLGNSAYVLLPQSLVGKRVRVRIDVLE